MKSKLLFFLGVGLLLASQPSMGQAPETTMPDSAKFSGGALVGSVTLDGKTYQQFALRADVPIGKFGFGVDLQILFDENGQIRKDDWDEWQDYLDKIYYIRYGKKHDPFYIKLGGLDYTYLGYSNIFNGYSNMVQYPSRKRYGSELSFYFSPRSAKSHDNHSFLETDTDYEGDEGDENEDNNVRPKAQEKAVQPRPWLGAEMVFNDFKEATVKSPQKASILFGTRVFLRPFRFLELGASFGADLNEYKAFLDKDGDGIPDLIDMYPSNNAWATDMDKFSPNEWDHLINDPFWGTTNTDRYNRLVELGVIPADTSRMADLFNLSNQMSRMYAYSFDIGIPIVEKDMVQFHIYSHITQLKGSNHTYGWGAAVPGIRLIVGSGNVNNFLTFKAEYRRASKEFLFGYFNNTYELERATFIGRDSVVTKQQKLLAIQEEMNGIYASAEFNFFNYITVFTGYQELIGKTSNMRSLHGELRMGEALQKILSFADVKGYYIQNNVQDFKEWKTPSTLIGMNIGYNYKGAIVGFDYRWTFQDLDGNGIIRGKEETFKTISFRTAFMF